MTNLGEMMAWLDAPRAAQEEADEGKEAFSLTVKIFEHDANVRACELKPLPAHAAQMEHMEGMASTRAELAQRLDALCDGATAGQLDAQEAAPRGAPDLPVPRIMKKSALVAELAGVWPDIERDLQEASRNGLKCAAHTGTHGEWDAAKAREWARRKGKLNKLQSPVQTVASPWAGL